MYKDSIHYFYDKFVSFYDNKWGQNQRAINVIAEEVLDEDINLSQDITNLQEDNTVGSAERLRGRIRMRNDPRQACKNITSGKYFLFIEETTDEKLLLVIPTGEVKPLNTSLFEEIEEINIADLLNKGLLTQRQIDRYKKFLGQDSVKMFYEIMGQIADVENWSEIFTIAKERMSMEQYAFVINRLATEVSRLK